MSFVDFALQVAGLPDQTIADLHKDMPAMARLATTFRQLQPMLAEAKPHVDALQAIYAKAAPIVQKEWPDLVSVTPTVQQLIDFIKSKEST